MKKYLFIAIVIVSGAIAAAPKASAAAADPSCPGHGQDCTSGKIVYVKCPTC